MRRLVVAWVLCLFTSCAAAQTNEAPVENVPLPLGLHGILAFTSISFSFDPRSPDSPSWGIEIRQDLTGTYRVKDGASLPITIGAATMKRISAGDAKVNSGDCETKLKNIAQTGKKSITYVIGVALSHCTFNYSDDEELNAVASTFQAIAQTIETGAKLKHDHRFDHLGLDADLDSLMAAAKQGWAIELQNIAPILQSIVEDDEMMSPARRKAKTLLDMAAVQAAPSPR